MLYQYTFARPPNPLTRGINMKEIAITMFSFTLVVLVVGIVSIEIICREQETKYEQLN